MHAVHVPEGFRVSWRGLSFMTAFMKTSWLCLVQEWLPMGHVQEATPSDTTAVQASGQGTPHAVVVADDK